MGFEQESIFSKVSDNSLKKGHRKGTHCPTCGQFVKIYARTIHSTMAFALIKFYKLSNAKGFEKSFFPLIELAQAYPKLSSVSRGGDFAKLSYWGLVEEQPKDPNLKHKKTSGMWRVTDKGVDFIFNRIKVPKYAYVYNGELQNMEPFIEVGIEKCLGKKFNYAELMVWK